MRSLSTEAWKDRCRGAGGRFSITPKPRAVQPDPPLSRARLLLRLLLPGVLYAPGTWAQQARSPSEADALPTRPAASALAPDAKTTPPGAVVRVEPPLALVPLTVDYPQAASGSASVVLEVTVDEDGRVAQARAEDGPHPFTVQAERAALSWFFTPARQVDTQTGATHAVAARIRVQVQFEPPAPPVQEPVSGTAPGATFEPLSPLSEPQTSEDEAPTAYAEVTVEGDRAQPSQRLSRTEIRLLPGAFGDPFRAIEVLPGVTPVATGLPFFYVRGAPPGNGGYFFDGIAIPALYHAAVGPGVIHPAFIEAVELYASVAPVRYGRFAGATIVAEAAQPSGRVRAEGSVRLVDAGAFLEIPFADGKGSLMVAGRYSYTGAVLSLLVPEVSIGYWDYQAKLTYALSSDATLTLFGFGAYDFLSAENEFGERRDLYDVTFHRAEARYTRQLGTHTAFSLALGAGLDRTDAGNGRGDAGANLAKGSAVVRGQLEHRLTGELRIRAGGDVAFERLEADVDALSERFDGDEIERDRLGRNLEILPPPGVPDSYEDFLIDARRLRRQDVLDALFTSRDDWLGGAWIDAPWQASRQVLVTPGVRIDSYRTGEAAAFAFEPRVDVSYRLSSGVSLLHGFGIAHQPPSFGAPIPGLSGSVGSGLQRAAHSYAGAEVELPMDVTATLTAFQSALFGGSDALGLLNLQRSDPSVDAAVDRTTGHAYGLEVYLRRALTQRLGGFLAYTLSHTTRSIGRLQGPSSFDRAHVVNAALAYDMGKGWRAGGRVAIYTGFPAEVAYVEVAANPPRAPAFFRLDWRLEKRWALNSEGAFLAVVVEVLNTTLSKEVLNVSCYAYGCSEEAVGPVTIPSLGVEFSY